MFRVFAVIRIFSRFEEKGELGEGGYVAVAVTGDTQHLTHDI